MQTWMSVRQVNHRFKGVINMARISAYDSSSISTLFSSLNSRNSKGGNDILGINYSDYATIRNGSYYKLMKAYYAKDTADEASKQTNNPFTNSSDETKAIAKVEDTADTLSDTAEKLYKNNTLFHKSTTIDSSGKAVTEYKTDDIYKAVSDFVSDYNAVIKAADKTDNTKITSVTESMADETSNNKSLLADIGITIDDKNVLSIDEKKFKASDMTAVKSLFNGTGSYAYSTAVKASKLEYYAKNETSQTNTYGSTGKYNFNYSAGSIYSSQT